MANALCITSFHQSLGETFTLARFAADLRAAGWRIEFLASDFAAAFLREQGHTITPLARGRETNEALLQATLRRLAPSLIVTADFFLFEATDARQMWSTRWLTDSGVPVLTFDHLKFHPAVRDITLGFRSRFDRDPALVRNFEGVPAGAVPRGTVRVPALPKGVTLVRPCPVHDPRPLPDPRIRFYDVERRARVQPAPEKRQRRGEKIVVVPVGSWAIDLARHVRLPYPDLLAKVLLRCFEGSPERVRIVLVGQGLKPSGEVRGRVTLELVSGMAFNELQDLLCGADLVLGDNATSATLGRAVMAEVPVAIFVNSVRIAEPFAIDAPFALTRFARELIESTEQSAPGSIFPFAVYPLGWRAEMRPLFERNPYGDAVEWLELFDEEDSAARLERLLFDPAARERLIARQREYRRLVEALPGAAEMAGELVPMEATA